jgi:hypothetical protein
MPSRTVRTLPAMDRAGAGGTIVWQRSFDEKALRRRWRFFTRWYVIPLVVALLVALVLGGPGAMLGVFILFGGIGALLAFALWLYDRSLREHPEIHLVDGRLVQGDTAVCLDDVEVWSTLRSLGSSATASPIAVVIFRVPHVRDGRRGVRPDGGAAYERVRFGWTEMTSTELDEVRRALAPHVPAPWVPADELHDWTP